LGSAIRPGCSNSSAFSSPRWHSSTRKRPDLLVENLLLPHPLQVELRSRPRPDLKTRDRFYWLLVRRLYPDWKQHPQAIWAADQLVVQTLTFQTLYALRAVRSGSNPGPCQFFVARAAYPTPIMGDIHDENDSEVL